MSDFEHRNHSFDYAPPERRGGSGALLLAAGVIGLFLLAMLFIGGGQPAGDAGIAPGADPATAPAVDTAPAAPIAPGAVE